MADKWLVVQINSHWPYLLRYGRGEPSCFDHFVEAGAQRLVEMVKAKDIDEIVVVGHSGGGVLGPAVVARALELDPALGTHGAKLVLLTPGSLMPGIGLHRHATRVRQRSVSRRGRAVGLWIDVQARADVLNFYDFDLVEGIGIDAGRGAATRWIWKVRIREMLSPEFYRKRRLDLFRMHYQFIRGNDQRAHYEYMMLDLWADPGRSNGRATPSRRLGASTHGGYERLRRSANLTVGVAAAPPHDRKQKAARQEPRQHRHHLVVEARNDDALAPHEPVIALGGDATGRARHDFREIALGHAGARLEFGLDRAGGRAR